MQKVIGEEFAQDLNEGETRWTKEGLLDIREEVTQDVTGEGAYGQAKPVGVEEEDDGLDDDFET